MLHWIAIAGAAATAATVQPAPSVPLSPAVKKDLHCFMLFAAAVDGAKEDKVRQGASMAVEYYLGRIDVGAPGLDLGQAVRQEGAVFDRDPGSVEAIGKACDAEFSKRSSELVKLGEDLQKTKP